MSDTSTQITEDEIISLVCNAVLGVDGIHALGANMSAAAITKNLLSRENKARGVHLLSDEDGFVIDIYVIVAYGTKIPETAWNVQKSVYDNLKVEYEIEPSDINIHIQGVHEK